MLLVKVGRLGAPIKEIALNDHSLACDAIRAAGMSFNESSEEIHTMDRGAIRYEAPIKSADVLVIEPKKFDKVLYDIADYLYNEYDVSFDYNDDGSFEDNDDTESLQSLIRIIESRKI